MILEHCCFTAKSQCDTQHNKRLSMIPCMSISPCMAHPKELGLGALSSKAPMDSVGLDTMGGCWGHSHIVSSKHTCLETKHFPEIPPAYKKARSLIHNLNCREENPGKQHNTTSTAGLAARTTPGMPDPSSSDVSSSQGEPKKNSLCSFLNHHTIERKGEEAQAANST